MASLDLRIARRNIESIASERGRSRILPQQVLLAVRAMSGILLYDCQVAPTTSLQAGEVEQPEAVRRRGNHVSFRP
jgi:hypothetical protein